MERLHRNSQGFAVTLSGSTAISVRPTGFTTIPHIDPATGVQSPRKVKYFEYKPNYQAQPVALVWDNDLNVIVVEDAIAHLLLGRKWAGNVSVAQFEWWNGEVDKLELAAAENLIQSQQVSGDGAKAPDALAKDALSTDTTTQATPDPKPVAPQPEPTPAPVADNTPPPVEKTPEPAPTPEPVAATPAPPAGRQRNKPKTDADADKAKADALARAEAEQSAASNKGGDA